MLGFLSRYGLAAHLAFAAVAPLFLSPVACLWLAALAALWFIQEPSRIGGETLRETRRRVRDAVVRDPLFWVLLFLVLVAGIRALNSGVERVYDAEAAVWTISDPSSTIFPGCVEGAGFPLFTLAVTLFIVVTSCRHALGRSARLAFLLISSFLSSIGALVWSVLLKGGHVAAQNLAATSYETPVFLGSACGVYLVFALFGLAAAFELKWFKAMPFSILGVAGNAAGLFLFAPPFVTLLFFAVTILLFLVYFVLIRIRLGNPQEFKFLVVFGISLTLGVLVVLGTIPRELEALKLAPYLEGAPFLPDDYRAARGVLALVSWRAWMTHPWIGLGAGSFPLALSFFATSTDWAVLSSCQTAPLGGYWLLLAERGALGAFFLIVPLALLFVTFVRRLVQGVLKGLPHPLVLLGPMLLIAAGLEMAGDVTFLFSGALVPLAAAFALSPHGFLKESSHG